MSFDLPSFRDGNRLDSGARREKTVGDQLKDAIRQSNMSGGHGPAGISLKIEFIGRLNDALSQRYPQRGTKIRLSGADTQPSVLVIDDIQWVQLDSWQCRFTFTFRAARLGEGGEDVQEPAEQVFEMSVGCRIEEYSQPGVIKRTYTNSSTGPSVIDNPSVTVRIQTTRTYERTWKTRSITISQASEPMWATGILFSITAPTGVVYRGILRSYSGKPNTTSAGWVCTFELESLLSERLIREITL